MNFTTLICPICTQRLTVSSNAPKLLVCPNCFAKINNPLGRAPGAAPLPVIPIEQQTSSDSRFTNYAIVITVASLAFGLALILISGHLTTGAFLVFLLIALGVLAACVLFIPGMALSEMKKISAPPPLPATPPPFPTSPQAEVHIPSTIEYRTPKHFTPSDPVNILATLGGFFLSIGVCAGGFFLLAATLQSAGRGNFHGNPIYLALVAFAVIGLIIVGSVYGNRPGLRGFKPALFVGLTLGMMALGPCGFCYLISLT